MTKQTYKPMKTGDPLAVKLMRMIAIETNTKAETFVKEDIAKIQGAALNFFGHNPEYFSEYHFKIIADPTENEHKMLGPLFGYFQLSQSLLEFRKKCNS